MTDADNLIQSLAQPVAVVGNGTIRKQHAAIESHATVIRFNDFADAGHELDVGHSIHVWCVTCCGKVKPRILPHPVKVMTIATLAEQPIDIPGWLETYPDMAVPAVTWIASARRLKGANPTTGLTLLVRIMLHKIKFTAFGFDGLRSGHYWDKDHQHTDSHGDELAALMELAKFGAKFA